jgi:hypothetical protein
LGLGGICGGLGPGRSAVPEGGLVGFWARKARVAPFRAAERAALLGLSLLPLFGGLDEAEDGARPWVAADEGCMTSTVEWDAPRRFAERAPGKDNGDYVRSSIVVLLVGNSGMARTVC